MKLIKNTRIVYIISILVLMVTSLASAQNSSENYDPDFFFKGITETCSLPCWYGIEISETNRTVLDQFLNEINWETIDTRETTSQPIYYEVTASESYVFADMKKGTPSYEIGDVFIFGFILNDIVEAVSLIYKGRVAESISPHKIVTELGSPTEIRIAYEEIVGDLPEAKQYFEFIYEDLQTAVRYYTITNSNFDFCFFTRREAFTYLQIVVYNPAAPAIEQVTAPGIALDIETAKSFFEETDLSRKTFANWLFQSEEPCFSPEELGLSTFPGAVNNSPIVP